jgi:histidinol-phosphate aminotransferase
MITRRGFARELGWMAAGGLMWTEAALAQRALVRGKLPREMVWLNANENPDGPGRAAIEAMNRVVPHSWRYHYQEFGDFYSAVARSEGLERAQVLVGAGSSEILHAAIDAFTSPSRPLITMAPTFEGPQRVARGHGHPVVRVPLTSKYAADVKRMVEEAGKARGGLIYLCNPNNPTSTITRRGDIAWLVSNLPPHTVVLIDEAYIHFSESSELESTIRYVREEKDVVVVRTFSKIYGMAGLRVGFGCAKPEFIQRMRPFRDNVISIVSARAARAALGEAATLVPERRATTARIRGDLCAWLRKQNIHYIEPNTNFMMIDVRRNVREILPAMYQRGVAPGRPFPPLNNFMRVTIGTEADMKKFKSVFLKAYRG